ncbi:MAG TPA: insecticidal toxin complex protein, partial [Pseudomonas sp.]|nr:insecticidal toxin complex protein [Pseudomonas sp.]
PAYRFRQLLPAARASVRQLLDLGRHYMKLMEDESDATFSTLLKAQEIKISDFTLRLKKEAISAATAKKHSLKASRRTALFRREYYEALIENGRSGLEDMAARAGLVGASLQLAAAPWAVSEGAAETVPRVFGFSFGGQDISGPLQAAKEVAEGMADFFKWTSDQLHREAEYQRRAEQWGFDLRMAERDIAQIDQEIAAQDIEINATNISLEESRQERLNLEEAYAVMTSGFVITPVYNWLVSRQELLYGAAYDAVLSLCLSLEAAWRYEIGDYGHEAFIKTSAWSDSYKGMLAGESLLVDLQEMENAYLLANERRLTIKRSFSVKGAQTDTDWRQTLTQLSQRKAVMFDFKSADFDSDYPGHYLRQLKHVSVSFVLASGKTLDGLSAILTQTDNTVLVEPDDQGATYLYQADGTPPASIKRNLRAQQQIALSSSVAEDGLGFGPGEWVYELMFHDGRYLPFEGTGAISRWQLQIPGSGFAQSLAPPSKVGEEIVKDIQINLVYTALAGDSGLITKIEELRKEIKA